MLDDLNKNFSKHINDSSKDSKNIQNLEILISTEQLDNRIYQLANQISDDYFENSIDDIILICILKGSIMFTADLSRKLNINNIQIEFMTISSYGNSQTSGDLEVIQDLNIDIKNKHIIIIEDIVDTGKTLSYLIDYLSKKQPASFKLCTLLDKPSKRLTEVTPDYIGFTIEDLFVIGYGLDYMQKFRNLPYIAHII